ncbi:AraC family transcriptional regulator [Sinomicrobium sp. M5D2P9]
MKLHIKNMVCSRCKMIVRAELEKLGLQPLSVELGEVEFSGEISGKDKEEVEKVLQPYGFTLIDDKKSRLIEKVKSRIIELVHGQEKEYPKTNLSDYLSRELLHDYTYLSNLFTQIEGTTIEKYFIAQKIERVKELLVYDELSLGEIAFQLHYSSVAHLSRQFKKVTGLTPSHFKRLGEQKRKPLEEL